MKNLKFALIETNFSKTTNPATVEEAYSLLSTNPGMKCLQPGQSVAICVGSRTINSLPDIIRKTVAAIRLKQCNPFIVPCMGSHGGGSSEGQLSVLEELKITESSMGCPVKSSMGVVKIGQTGFGVDVLVDTLAAGADHIIPINRIKPHPGFFGSIQSGLIKILVIGLGNHIGAQKYHNAFEKYGFGKVVKAVSSIVIRNLSIPFCVGIVEDENHHTLCLEFIRPAQLYHAEQKLLKLAEKRLVRLPKIPYDILIIDQIGKDINGSGMDPNAIGLKKKSLWLSFKSKNKPALIYVRGLSSGSHGNAAGVGMATAIHDRLVKQVNWPETYTNCLTSGAPRSAAMPMTFINDLDAVTKLSTMLGKSLGEIRIIRIKDTLNLFHFYVTEPLVNQIEKYSCYNILQQPEAVKFNLENNLDPDFTP